jgi:SAM-dependent methyltransferase
MVKICPKNERYEKVNIMVKLLSYLLSRLFFSIVKWFMPEGNILIVGDRFEIVSKKEFELVPKDNFDVLPKGEYDYVPKGTYVYGPMENFLLVPKNRYRATLLPGQTINGDLGIGWITEENTPEGYDSLWGDNENLAAFRAEADHIRDVLTTEIADVVSQHLSPKAEVVDIGCGVGDLLLEVTKRQPQVKVAGLDFSPKAVEGAQKALPVGEFMRFTIEQTLPYPSDTFDVVMCTDVLEHLEYPQDIVKELVRICRPGGSVFIVVPDGDVDVFLGHYWFWNQTSLEAFLADWGAAVHRLPVSHEFIAHISLPQ